MSEVSKKNQDDQKFMVKIDEGIMRTKMLIEMNTTDKKFGIMRKMTIRYILKRIRRKQKDARDMQNL
jgi:hypothetical protein